MNISPLFVLSISPPPCVSRLATTISQSTFRGRRGKPFAQTLHVLCPSISVLFVGLLLRGRLSKVTPLEDCSLSPQWRWRGGFDERCAPTLLQKSCNRHFIGHRHWKGFPPVRLTTVVHFPASVALGRKGHLQEGSLLVGLKPPPPHRGCVWNWGTHPSKSFAGVSAVCLAVLHFVVSPLPCIVPPRKLSPCK